MKTIQLVREMRADVTQLVDMLLSTPNMEQRTVGVGRLDPQVARDYSPVGPMIRASGFARDVRFDHPFADYGNLPKTLFTMDGCDVYSRVMVRVKEVLDSLSMIEYALDNMPEGPILTEGFTYQPHKFALGYTEAPRGKISTGACWVITRNCSAGAAARPLTLTGRCCATCCRAIPFPMRR